eukprot:8994127-Alexandrium_andersonii.AAC.1
MCIRDRCKALPHVRVCATARYVMRCATRRPVLGTACRAVRPGALFLKPLRCSQGVPAVPAPACAVLALGCGAFRAIPIGPSRARLR